MAFCLETDKEAFRWRPKTARIHPQFQLFFLKEDANESVEVVEVEEIDFGEVAQRLHEGDSVFITHKHPKKLGPSLHSEGTAREPWYFIHF